MNKQAFLTGLEQELNRNRVPDADDILMEYQQHFAFKLADGYSEEEIAAKLGTPAEIALQYEEGASPSAAAPRGGKRAVLRTGLIFSDLVAGALWLSLAAAVLVIGAFAVACAAIGVLLILRLNVYALLPYMPYFGALLFGTSFLFLAVLSAVGTVYSALYLNSWTKRYCSWRRSLLDGGARPGPARYSSFSVQSNLSGKSRRRLRTAAVLSLTGFGVTAVVGMVAMFAYTDFRPFWHALGWFGYVGAV